MRIVSLCPSITKLIFDLGSGEHLVGITKYCVHPRGAVTRKTKIGGTKDPDHRRIIDLRPDLIFLNQEENRLEDWELLKGEGFRCHISYPLNVKGAAETVRDIGRFLARNREAECMATAIEIALHQVSEMRHHLTHLNWIYLIWRKPWMTINRTTYIHGLISAAGGNNSFADLNHPYPSLTADQIGSRNPDRVFLSSEPFPFKKKHIQELSTATGLPPDRFVLVDGELLSWHGAFTERGLRYAHSLLWEAV